MSYHEVYGPEGKDGPGLKLSHIMFILYLPENAGEGKLVAGLGTALGRNSVLLHQRANLLMKSLEQTLHLLNPFFYFPHLLSPTNSPLGTGINHGRQTFVELPVLFI